MNTAVIASFGATQGTSPFCERGSRLPRNEVNEIDPVVSVGDTGMVYDPGKGFNKCFEVPHNRLSDAWSDEKVLWYNNYPCLKDFNLIFYLASIGSYLSRFGLSFPREEVFSDQIGGYPWGAIVRGGDGRLYISAKSDNTDDVGSDGGAWVPYRNSWWFSFAERTQNANGVIRETPPFTVVFNHPGEQGHYRKIVTRAGGTTAPAGIPLVVYRLHSVREKTGGQNVHTWVQAYKYWIRCYPTDPTSSEVKTDEVTSARYVYLYSDVTCETAVRGYDGTATGPFARLYLNSSTSGYLAASMPAIGVGGQTYNGKNGFFTIRWMASSASTESENTTANPFNHILDDDQYSLNYTSPSSELALDIGLHGYGRSGFPVVPEYDETENVLESEVVVDDGFNASTGEYITQGRLRSGCSVLTDNFLVGLDDDQKVSTGSILFTTDNAGASGEYARATPSETPLKTAESEPTCPIAFPFVDQAVAQHHQLSSGPFYLRRGMKIELCYAFEDGEGEETTVPVCDVASQSWTEFTAGKVQKTRGQYSWWVYNVETVPDVLCGPWRRYRAEPAASISPVFVGTDGKGSGRYVMRMTCENIGLPRAYEGGSASASVSFDNVDGTYQGTRMMLGFAAYPYEHALSSLTSASFGPVPPDVW